VQDFIGWIAFVSPRDTQGSTKHWPKSSKEPGPQLFMLYHLTPD